MECLGEFRLRRDGRSGWTCPSPLPLPAGLLELDLLGMVGVRGRTGIGGGANAGVCGRDGSGVVLDRCGMVGRRELKLGILFSVDERGRDLVDRLAVNGLESGKLESP